MNNPQFSKIIFKYIFRYSESSIFSGINSSNNGVNVLYDFWAKYFTMKLSFLFHKSKKGFGWAEFENLF